MACSRICNRLAEDVRLESRTPNILVIRCGICTRWELRARKPDLCWAESIVWWCWPIEGTVTTSKRMLPGTLSSAIVHLCHDPWTIAYCVLCPRLDMWKSQLGKTCTLPSSWAVYLRAIKSLDSIRQGFLWINSPSLILWESFLWITSPSWSCEGISCGLVILPWSSEGISWSCERVSCGLLVLPDPVRIMFFCGLVVLSWFYSRASWGLSILSWTHKS